MPFTYEYARPMVSVDIILLTKSDESFEILLIQRKNDPFQSFWALPGGFMDIDETLEEAAIRELKEETGISGIKLKQFKAFSTLERDPRGRTITVMFYAISDKHPTFATDDASDARWFHFDELPQLAFDHNEVLFQVKEDILSHF